MDIHGNSENRDVFGNESRNAFGGSSNLNSFGNPPSDVWGNHLAADESHLRHEDHHDHHSLFGSVWDFFFGTGHHD